MSIGGPHEVLPPHDTKVNRVVKVLDFVKSGGPELTVGGTTFEVLFAL